MARPGSVHHGLVAARLVHLSAPLSVALGVLIGQLVRSGADGLDLLSDAVERRGPPRGARAGR